MSKLESDDRTESTERKERQEASRGGRGRRERSPLKAALIFGVIAATLEMGLLLWLANC